MSTKDEGLTHDELIAAITGQCVHEVQVNRVMGLLGLIALANGGKVTLSLEGLDALENKGIDIRLDQKANTATVEVVNVSAAEGPQPEENIAEPTHYVSSRHH